jgi:hypothetical protein
MGYFRAADGLAELRNLLDLESSREFSSIAYCAGGPKHSNCNIDSTTVLRDLEMAFRKKAFLNWRTSLRGARSRFYRLLLHHPLDNLSKLRRHS